MSYVKALYGSIIGSDVSLEEGAIGFTEKDHQLKDLEKAGKLKLFATLEEAEAFKYIPSSELFLKSYKTLNPPEGETPPPSLIDFVKGGPIVTDGIPSNYIIEPVIETPKIKEVVVVAPKVEEVVVVAPEVEVIAPKAPEVQTPVSQKDKK